MAYANPVAVVREIDSSPHHTREVHEIVGMLEGGGSYTFTVETHLKKILRTSVLNETDGAVVATTIAASTDYPNTQKVSFSVAADKVYSYSIVGLYNRAATVDTLSGNTTIEYNPVAGD